MFEEADGMGVALLFLIVYLYLSVMLMSGGRRRDGD